MSGPARRKVANQQEAEGLLAEFANAGGDLSSFCGARGLDGRSLHAWSLNLGRLSKGGTDVRVSGGAQVRLVEVVPATRQETVESRAAARYRVLLGDVAVEVDDHFREDTLARLLEVVRSC
jgi:hypothetical protein